MNWGYMRKGKKSLKIPQGVIRISNSKKDRQHNGQKKKAKGQTTIIKTLQWKLDWVTQTQLKTGGELMCSGRVASNVWTYQRDDQKL